MRARILGSSDGSRPNSRENSQNAARNADIALMTRRRDAACMTDHCVKGFAALRKIPLLLLLK
jgi:hypothetical protein